MSADAIQSALAHALRAAQPLWHNIAACCLDLKGLIWCALVELMLGCPRPCF